MSSSSARRAVHTRRGLAVALGLVAAIAGGVASASAYWGATTVSGASGSASAATVGQGATPSATSSPGRLVSVSWGASTLSNGHAVDGYLVHRYDTSGGAAQTPSGGCSGTVAVTSCTETDVPAGQWQYTVTPALASHWQGVESPRSGTVTLAAATLTLAKSLFGGSLPQITTGSLAGFAANEAVTYRLDAGTALTGSPSTLSATGTATITALTIPTAADGPHTVYAVGGASPNPTIASAAIVIDTTPPTVTAQLSPAANPAGWNTAPVTVTLTGSDGTGSGVGQIKYTTDGSNPTSSGTAVLYTSPIVVAATTTLTFYATDTAGNASLPMTQQVKVDAAAPTNAITLSGVTGAALLTGGTVYYRGSTGGSLTLTNAAGDTGGSGVGSSTTTTLTGVTSGWTHTPSLVSTPTGGPFVSNPFTWAAGTSSAPSDNVVASDIAGNTATTSLSFVNDTTGPTGGSIDATGLAGTGGRWSTSLGLNLALSKGSSPLGLGSTGAQVLRESAPLSTDGSGTCGTYTGGYAPITGGSDPATPLANTVPADDTCYRYEYIVPDALGVTTTYTSPDIKVDTAPAPTTPTFTFSGLGTSTYWSGTGATVFYNPTAASGTFTVTAHSTDADAGIASYLFPSFPGGWTSTAGTLGLETYAWAAVSPTGPAASQSVSATNRAGTNSTSGTFTVTADNTAPSGGNVSYVNGIHLGSILVSFSPGTDVGAGLNGGVLQRRSATTGTLGLSCGAYGGFTTIATNPASPYIDLGMIGSNCYQYQYVAYDNVGNSMPYASAATAWLVL
ncbi:MAG TPA: chitobiase/beta-hexosaminidase C-terminal domain-containing protein [Solirubrobacteraceae bacterium]